MPNGPLPPSVYWRRRAVAFGAALVTLIFSVLLLRSWVAGSNTETQQAPVEQAVIANSSSVTPTESSSVPTTTQASSSSSTASGSSSSLAPSQPCVDKEIGVSAEVGQPEYRIGQSPAFRLVVTNIGQQDCVRDLNASLQELVVTSADGATRLWSSNDCFSSSAPDVRVLKPGVKMIFGLNWAELSSQPGCAGQRQQIPPGEYHLVARLGGLTSPPTVFRLTA